MILCQVLKRCRYASIVFWMVVLVLWFADAHYLHMNAFTVRLILDDGYSGVVNLINVDSERRSSPKRGDFYCIDCSENGFARFSLFRPIRRGSTLEVYYRGGNELKYFLDRRGQSGMVWMLLPSDEGNIRILVDHHERICNTSTSLGDEELSLPQ